MDRFKITYRMAAADQAEAVALANAIALEDIVEILRDVVPKGYIRPRAGADIVKEDHGFSNQDAAPFRERLKACATAVARANAKRANAGDPSQALYFASIGGHRDKVRDQALCAKDAEATSILLILGFFGFDTPQRLARDPESGLPIMAHPSHVGPYVLSPDRGHGHGMLFGQMTRL